MIGYLIARALSRLKYQKPRAIGVKQLEKLSDYLLNELIDAQVIVCANSDIVSEIKHYNKGKLTNGKIVLDLKMNESDHAIASGHHQNKKDDLSKRLIKILQNFGL